MRKLNVKCAGIASAKLDFFREGIFKGTLGVQLEMSGAPLTYEDVCALMSELQQLALPQKRVVRFAGKLEDGDINFVLLVKSLYDYKYDVQCVVPNGRTFSWLQWMSWIIITTDQRIVLTSANEIWFTPPTGPALVDIVFPPSAHPPFLFLAGRVEVDVAMEFMCASKQSWALL